MSKGCNTGRWTYESKVVPHHPPCGVQQAGEGTDHCGIAYSLYKFSRGLWLIVSTVDWPKCQDRGCTADCRSRPDQEAVQSTLTRYEF
jgi:hypothetical protein